MGVWSAKIEKELEDNPSLLVLDFFSKRGIKDTLTEFNAQIKH